MNPEISLRDYFAAAALQGLLASDDYMHKPSDPHENDVEHYFGTIAVCAYAFADQMLRARQYRN